VSEGASAEEKTFKEIPSLDPEGVFGIVPVEG